MSQPSTSYRENNKPASNRSRRWIVLSLVLSTLILGWAFSQPFRQGGQPLLTSTNAGHTSSDPSPESSTQTQRRPSSEEFRQAAIALDEEFMQMVAEKHRRPKNLPGKREARAHWNRHVASVKRQLERLKDAEPDSLEWRYRQSLIESLQDGPQ